MTPAGPVLRRIWAPSRTLAASSLPCMQTAVTFPPNRWVIAARTRSPSSGLRDVIVTLAPARARRPAARVPTGPVPAVTTVRLPFTSPTARMIFTTAATAVVFEPLESSMSDTLNGPNSVFFAASSSFSPAAMNEIDNINLGNATATHDCVRTAVVRDDLVEHAGETRGVELQQQLQHD